MSSDPDLSPQRKKPAPLNLYSLSVPELKEYIAELKAEILRAEEETARKEKHLRAADALFKKQED
jgi:uncharacterized small protein (DUF1192 family)